MKSILVTRTGGPEVLELKEIHQPEPGPGEVAVRIAATGVNYIDTYHRRGLYPLSLPFTPGIEGAGTICAIGPDTRGFKEGDRVVFCLGMGGYAEVAVVPAWKIAHLPDKVDFETGVAAMCQGLTAHYLTHDTYHLKAGRTALVHAAAGGVGLLLVQMAHQMGARVLGTVSTEEKAKLAREAGADLVIRYDQEDFEARAREFTDGAGVDVVYESVGRVTFEKSLNCLRPRGYLVLFGQSSGPVGAFDPQILNQKGSLFLTRPSLGHYMASGEEFAHRAQAVLTMIAEGRLKTTIGDRLPLSEAAEAHRRLEGRRTVGKVILLP